MHDGTPAGAVLWSAPRVQVKYQHTSKSTADLLVQVVWLVDTVILLLTWLYSLCRVVVVRAGLCWWWLSVYLPLSLYVTVVVTVVVVVLLVAFVFVSSLLRLSLPLCRCHVVVEMGVGGVVVILVHSSLLIIVDASAFEIAQSNS